MNTFESPEERGQRLQEKLKGNHQRNRRRAYLEWLPADLRAYLAERGFLSMAEFAAVSPQFVILPDGFGVPPLKPTTYRYREFGWRHKVLQAAEALDGRHDAQSAYFWPMDDNPIYRVDFGWVRLNMRRLLNHRAGVIAADYTAGIVVDDYCGYLPGDYNPAEVVYELGVWGFDGLRLTEQTHNSPRLL